jgi:hypothetical protein
MQAWSGFAASQARLSVQVRVLYLVMHTAAAFVKEGIELREIFAQ